jgi:hypothetical protein
MLVAARQVYLKAGFAYVPLKKLAAIIVTRVRKMKMHAAKTDLSLSFFLSLRFISSAFTYPALWPRPATCSSSSRKTRASDPC